MIIASKLLSAQVRGRREFPQFATARHPENISAALVQRDSKQFLFFFVNDDSRSHHQHDAGCFATDTRVLKQSADVRNLVEDWHTGHVATFTQSFDSAEKHGAAVWDAD